MKIAAIVVCGVLAFACAGNLAASETKSDPKELAKLIPQETRAERDARMAWWTESRFGMFIHFGLYATPARGEWIKTMPEERGILVKESYAKYFKYFNPDQFDAKAWAKAAKAAGMRYAVLTAKHHEGFCLFDSKFTDYKITNTAFGRDLVKEFVEAFRAEGIRVGLYYSLIDWHHPDFTIDTHHPERPGDPKFWPDPRVTPADFEKANAGRDMAKYRAYMMNQIRELLTNYGRIDIVWYDFSYPGVISSGSSRTPATRRACAAAFTIRFSTGTIPTTRSTTGIRATASRRTAPTTTSSTSGATFRNTSTTCTTRCASS